jgi:RNA polymerase sigma-70 factor (ECF subfamily)
LRTVPLCAGRFVFFSELSPRRPIKRRAAASYPSGEGRRGQTERNEFNEAFRALAAGDRAAFAAVYGELAPPLYTVAWRILGDRAGAEDVVQEVFLRLFRGEAAAAAEPRAYCFAMARNLALDELRRRRREPPSETETAASDSAEETACARADTAAAMASLGREQREVVALRLNAGLRFAEIARITGAPLGTVLWRYQAAIRKLRTRLAGYGKI